MRKITTTLCLTIAVLLGSAGLSFSADSQKGFAAFKSGDYATALQHLRPLAEQGDAFTQSILGKIYEDGLGVSKDNKIAVKWYTLAAEQEYAPAQGNLGVMYAFGKGVLKDYVYAHMWGNIAASNGNKGGHG